MPSYRKSNSPGRLPAIVERVLPLLAIMLVVDMTIAAPRQLDLKGSAEVFGGYESNIFRNADTMEYPPSEGGGSYNPVKNDVAPGGVVKLRPTLTINKTQRLAGTFDADYQFFPRYSEANQGEALAGLEYRIRPVKPVTVKILGNGGYTRKLGVDEGSDATTLYEYWSMDFGPRIEFSPDKSFSTKVNYRFTLLDYKDADTTRSLDNRQHEVGVSLERSFGSDRNTIVGIEGIYLQKNYRTLGSYSASGTYFDRPLRTYHYATIELTGKHDFGPIVWKAGYRPRYRADAYDNFYTYIEHRISNGVAGKLPSQTTFSIDGAWRYRHYPVHVAAQPGNGSEPDLVMYYFDGSADVEQPLGKMFSLFAGYDMTMRRTNTGILYFHTYRDYIDHEVRAGVRIGW